MSNQILAASLFGGSSSEDTVMIDMKVDFLGYRYVLMDNHFKFPFDVLVKKILSENDNFIDGSAVKRLTKARVLENLKDLYSIADQKAEYCFTRFCIQLRDYFQGVRPSIEEGARTGLNFLLYDDQQFRNAFGTEKESIESSPAYLETSSGRIRVKKEELEKQAKTEFGAQPTHEDQNGSADLSGLPEEMANFLGRVRNTKYIEALCIENGLAESYLCDIYSFDSSEPLYQEFKTRIKSGFEITRLMLANLCILNHMQANLQKLPAVLKNSVNTIEEAA